MNLLMRKMGNAPSGVLNFGKSRGRIYGQDEITITLRRGRLRRGAKKS